MMRYSFSIALLVLFLGGQAHANTGEAWSGPGLPLVPPGLAQDFVVDPSWILESVGGGYVQLLQQYIPYHEAERRGTINERRWLEENGELWAILEGKKDAILEGLVEAYTGTTLDDIHRKDDLFMPYPNNINAARWRLFPFDEDKVTDDNYNVSARVLAETPGGDDYVKDYIFPLRRTFEVQQGSESREIPTFSAALQLMMRWHSGAPLCQGGSCVQNPYTGLLADRQPTSTGDGGDVLTWDQVVWQCSQRNGRLPTVGEAWYFLSSGRWTEGSLQIERGLANARNEYYVVTGDVLAVYDPMVLDSNARLLSQVKVAGIRVPIVNYSIQTVVNYDSIVYLQYSGRTSFQEQADNMRYRYYSVFYCVYD